MKKFTYIFSLTTITALLFTGCYTQVATNDGGYPVSSSQDTYGSDRNSQDQNQNYSYDDSSEYYGDYNDSTDNGGYGNNSDDNYGGYRSPSYYDDFYYSYPYYSRYFWGYYPSFSIGFNWGWGGFYYDPFYYGYWGNWYYPAYYYSPYYYYYPYSYCGYGYYYGCGYPSQYYYTYSERSRDMSRIRNLDGMRGGGREVISTGTRSGITSRSLTDRKSQDTRISTRTGNTVPGVRSGRDLGISSLSKDIKTGSRIDTRKKDGQRLKRPTERKSPSGYFNLRKDRQRIDRRNETALRDNRNLSPNERRQNSPFLRNQNGRKTSNGSIRPRTYNPPGREYNSSDRTKSSNNYVPPKREYSPRNYSSPQRYSSPRNYSSPRSYSPPQRSSSPPSFGGGGRSGGGSTGRGRR